MTLQGPEESRIPLRKVEERFHIQDTSLRGLIREALERLQPTEERQEPHCEYSFKFSRGKELLVIKQFRKGTLQIQGSAGDLYKTVLKRIVPLYQSHVPHARLSLEALLGTEESSEPVTGSHAASPFDGIQEIPLPHIGTDESGKGDYFGPLVVSGVLMDTHTKPELEGIGVKDSKLLSDSRCRELAGKIRTICRGRYEEVEISPERYNKLYEEFRKEGKNLNHLLAWGHARAIENLLEHHPCTHAVADQFGDAHYLQSHLMEKGKQIHLIQVPKGERDLAVAAASILSRDRFLARLEKLGQEYKMELPKGASKTVVAVAKQIVEKKGAQELRRLAKIHHRTTSKVLNPFPHFFLPSPSQ
jgi:ribonuclease HIII